MTAVAEDLLAAGPSLSEAMISADTAEWSVWSTVARIVVTRPGDLGRAYDVARLRLAQVDRAASRFRDDSEIRLLDGADGARTPVSSLLADLLQAALEGAAGTAGDVDPTLGRGMRAIGYDRDFSLIANRPQAAAAPATRQDPRTNIVIDGYRSATGPFSVLRRACWRDVALDTGDDGTRYVTMPPGVSLDLGATAKAYAADLIACEIADELGTGILVSLGGDIATAGEGPDGGWRIEVSDGPQEPSCTVALPAGFALATSSTIRRRWSQDGRPVHHILDPHTGQPAEPVWRTVTVAATSCLEANVATTASVVRGAGAVAWLTSLGLQARLVQRDGLVTVVDGWPTDAGEP